MYFQKENIWTSRSEGKFLITLLSSLAQEESRSISQNTTWGIWKKRMLYA
ncbi:MAG: recombinase family protein [Lachnospiraceae bacterium]|nr:recombinase family protein [Lachnospiraceae bacterium]MDD7326534.1 recombinase family protein [Lachnospiraceae bacterium]MDY2760290.1 recombinase family protein [Lachnospiraceae bacterium]